MGLIVNALPEYSGPYPVATADLELAVANPRSFGHALLKSTTRPALQLDTVLVTLFYPADSTQRGSGNRQHWLQRPLGQTAEGYARFLGQKPWLVKALFWLVGARVRLPVQADRSLAPKKTDTTSEGASTASSQATAVDAGLAGEKGRFPLVVFSHGLSGTRTTYRCAKRDSAFCVEASLTLFLPAVNGVARLRPRGTSSLPSNTGTAQAQCRSSGSARERSALSITSAQNTSSAPRLARLLHALV